MKDFSERYGWLCAIAILYVIALIIPIDHIGLIISALVAIISFLRPKEGILSLVFFFPMRSFLIEIAPGLKLAGDLIIIAAFLKVLWMTRHNWKQWFQLYLFEWAFIAFIVIGAVSALITGVSLAAIVFQIRAFVITYLVFYVVKRLPIKKEDVIRFLWIIFITAMIMTVQGLVEKISLRSQLMPEAWVNRVLSPNNRVRVYGMINNPNMLAVFFSFAFMASLYLTTFVRTKMKWVIYVGLVLMMGVWSLTFSRGTIIGFMIALVVYFIFTRNWKKIVSMIVIIAIGFILVNLPATSLAHYVENHTTVDNVKPHSGGQTDQSEEPELSPEGKRLKDTFQLNTIELSKQTGRLFIVEKGFEIFKDHPILGTGFATYGDSASKSYDSPIYSDYDIAINIYSDNQYIQIITQTGILGVLSFAVFLLSMLVFVWKKRKENIVAIPVLAILIGIFFCGLIYNIWEDKTFTSLYFIMLGTVASPFFRKESVEE